MVINNDDFVFEIRNVEIFKRNSFLDYIIGGTELGLSIAIDFSHDEKCCKSSQHKFSDPRVNQFTSTIQEFVKLIQNYQTSQNFPIYGFGGDLEGIGKSQCFALNGNIFSPEIDSVEKILKTYKTALKTHKLGS